MRKYIETLYQKNGNPYPVYNPRSGKTMHKTAAKKSEAMIYADNVEKKHPDNEVIVVIGVTGMEYYGSNDNGDGFPTQIAPYLSEADLLQNNYKSFENGAKVYYQHDISAPPIGTILKAFWNEERKWIELVLELNHDAKDTDAIERARTGEMLGVSMGCDVSGDICSICHNRASTTDKHCTHIKNQLHQIIDGKVVMMVCPSPKFFDMSVVTVPADAITNSVYRKVASYMATFTDHEKSVKLAELLKTSSKVKEAVQKINNIYKGIDSKDLVAPENIKPIISDASNSVKDISGDTVFDEIYFFTKLGLPYSLSKISDKTGVSREEILKSQEKILSRMKDDPEYKDKIERLAMDFDSSKIKPAVSDNFLKMLPDADGERKSIEMAIDADSLGMFNILNKLSILDKVNYVKTNIAGAPVKNTDMEELLLLEQLLY